MPYVLASRGYVAEPWPEAAQMEQDKDLPWSGAEDASFKHYSRGYPGGKPTYNMKMEPGDEKLFKTELPEHKAMKHQMLCQMCYDLKTYIARWGSDRCTNKYHFEYSDKIKR